MDNRYAVFMIDPPWDKKKGGKRKSRPNQGRMLDYKTMSTDKIFELLDNDIFSLAEVNHTVFMWTTEQHLIECEAGMALRGYKRHCRMIWDKKNGMCPAFTVRYSHEYLIWYYKPKMLEFNKSISGMFCTVFTGKQREHSRKPDEAYSMVNSFYPNEKKLDVFTRETREGWSAWGDEVGIFDKQLTDKT